jgi:hypothetical protein
MAASRAFCTIDCAEKRATAPHFQRGQQRVATSQIAVRASGPVATALLMPDWRGGVARTTMEAYLIDAGGGPDTAPYAGVKGAD